MPTDLSDLFKHILGRIDLAYSKKSAEYLWIALHDKSEGLPVDAFYFHERDHENPNYAVEWPIGQDNQDVQAFATRRIAALTGGLLEVTSERRIVSFLHRTVAEFLLTRDISRDILTRVRPSFDVHLALAKIVTVLCKRFYRLGESLKTAANIYLPLVEPQNFATTMDLLQALEDTVTKSALGVATFKKILLHSPLSEQVSRKLSRSATYFLDIGTSPVVSLLQGEGLGDESVEMLRVLGLHGDGINHTTSETSPWASYFRAFTAPKLDKYVLSFRKLLAIGADPNAQVRYDRCAQSVFSVYLVFPFSYRTRTVRMEAYLDTLDAFLDRGANFWQPITFATAPGPIDERSWWPAKLDTRYNTAEKILSRALKLLGSDTQMMPSRDIAFHTVKRILAKRAGDAALMSRLRAPITQAFPDYMSATLLGMIPRARPSRQPKKRVQGGDEPGTPRQSAKRRRGK